MSTLSDNYYRIMDGISTACAKSNRRTDEITLVAVTKYVPIERIAPVFELGICHIGENRVQEFVEKEQFFSNYKIVTHFIGQLQTNKVKYIAGQVDLLQSVDRPSLARELKAQAEKKNVTQDVLIEVNIGEEEQKGGVLPHELMPLIEELRGGRINVKGLMCVPPQFGSEGTRPYFARMRELFDKCKLVAEMEHLSMGMSGDYAVAIEEGATMIRIGSALFGSRI